MIKNLIVLGLLLMNSKAENEIGTFIQPHESNVKM
jgi:hypothetical protein